MSEAEIAIGGGAGDGKVDRDAIEAMNRAAQESFNVHGMEKCENCGRTFAEGRLAIHSKSCRPDNVAKKVGDGAAPRNKAGATPLEIIITRVHPRTTATTLTALAPTRVRTESQVDYGRAKANVSNSSSESSSTTPASVKKSQSRAATDSASSSQSSVPRAESPSPPPGSSSSATRALAGSIASNRKRIPAHDGTSADSTGDRRASRQLQTPLAAGIAESVTIEQLRGELGGNESAIGVICAKLEQWEATTLATLQEIRDLKQIFSDVMQQ